LTKEVDGLAFKNNIWENKSSIKIFPVTIVTGNNGSGKSVLLNAIMLGQGGSIGRTSVKESKQEDEHIYTMAVKKDTETYGSIKISCVFDNTFYHNPIEHIRGIGAVYHSIDCLRVWGWKKSHGENLKNLYYRNWEISAKEQHNSISILHLIDEVESGLSLETLEEEIDFLKKMTEIVISVSKQDRIPKVCVILATQNPILVKELVSVGAMRLDLGGWKNGDPFAKYLAG